MRFKIVMFVTAVCVLFLIREVRHDVTANGKRQTAKMKLLPTVFSCLYGRVKIFLFAVNSRSHLSISV